MLVGKKKAKSPVKKVSYVGTIVVRGRERKLYKGQKGGLFYRSKGVKVYVDKKTASREYRKKRVAAKRVGIMKFGTFPEYREKKRVAAKRVGIMKFGTFPEYREKKRVAAKRVGIMKFGKKGRIPNMKAIKRGLSRGISSTGIFRTNTRDRSRRNMPSYQKGKNINVSPKSINNLTQLYNQRLSYSELPNVIQQKYRRV